MSEAELRAVSIDLVALEAVVRAIARTQARRSRTALCDLLQSLSIEADRLRAATDLHGEMDDTASSSVVEGWIETLKDEARDRLPAVA